MILDVLAYRGISASRVRGIVLEDGRRRQTLSSLIEIHGAESSIVFNPKTAATGLKFYRTELQTRLLGY